MTPRLILKVIERRTSDGALEQLPLESGLNLIIGPSNSGKSRWLQMVDFLFGKERSAANFFGKDIAQKYTSVAAVIKANGVEHKLERQWSDNLSSEHVYVDGKPMDARHLSEFFLSSVSIPTLHFPRSRVLGDYTWPELGWRVLLRHIYRQEKYWSDIADRQPPPEQHAALLQFLGLAERVFSPDAQRYNQIRQELLQATTRKHEFEQLIRELAEGMLPNLGSSTSITEEMLDSIATKLGKEIEMLVEDRTAVLSRAVDSKPANDKGALSAVDVELGRRRVELMAKIESVRKDFGGVSNRIQKLSETQHTFASELERLDRARAAGDIFVDLKVTHCPVCDQEVGSVKKDQTVCYCCKQPYQQPSGDGRLDFEASQLREEFNETTLLLDSLGKQQAALQKILDEDEDELRNVENNLRPARAKVAAFIPPEIPILDSKRGKLEEKISHINRLKGMLRSRKELSKTIDQLTADLAGLEGKLNKPDEPIKWQESADKLSDGINSYLGLIALNARPWNQGRVTTKLSERNFRLNIDGIDWSDKLGGNYRCIFLVGYHYSLFRLTSDPLCHYPGLLIIDFPPNPTDQLGSNKTLNYLLSPFVELLKKPEMKESQMIASARELQPIEGVNSIILKKQWI